ncbi:MAG TPA: hypothetical protein VNJ08_12810 [Bacteriovoracaceae bacterium]|nr:hypothetical protein [Bacteriovoracaceae bacterium]
MQTNWKQTQLQKLKRAFQTDETRFIMSVGLKVSAISFFISSFVYYFLFQVMRLNHAFFKAHGFPEFAEDTPFYQYITQEALGNMPILFMFHIFLFFIGVYVGWLIMRPFRTLGEYCDVIIDNPHAIYKVDDFSTYKLLTRFSEFFFEFLRESRKRGEMQTNSIPPQYSKIHKPVLDKIFMLHFGLLLIIIAICSALFIIENASGIFSNMIELGDRTLPDYKAQNKFFAEQGFILDEIVYLTVFLVIVGYVMLGFHLYAKVSGAAFGIFSTMRAFMKGNHSSRVHLVGYAHIRDHTRKLNKFLDYTQNNLSKSKPNG